MTLFVTGTDTGVGKTHTAVRLLQALRAAGLAAAGFKPICCGDRADAEELRRASEEGLSLDDVNPIWLKAPLAPMPAAEIEGRKIEIDKVLHRYEQLRHRVDAVIVEGAGGWLVPIRTDYFVRDLAVALNAPVLVVALNRLGCLNHTLLTVHSVVHSGLSCVGVALNQLSRESGLAETTNAEVLRRLLNVPLLTGLSVDRGELPADWAAALGIRPRL